MYQIILMIHVLLCIGLVALVLIQQGKGANIGAAFGSGASNTVFGSQGSGSFLMKLTGSLAALFFFTSLGLGYIASQESKQTSSFQLPSQSQTQPVKQEKSNPVQPSKKTKQGLPKTPD